MCHFPSIPSNLPSTWSSEEIVPYIHLGWEVFLRVFPLIFYLVGDRLMLDSCNILESCQLLFHTGPPYFCGRVTRIFLLLSYCSPVTLNWATLAPLKKTGQGITLTERINSLNQYPDWTRFMAPPVSINYVTTWSQENVDAAYPM